MVEKPDERTNMVMRKIAGWAVLALAFLIIIALAVLAGQLAELFVGAGIAVLVITLACVSERLLRNKK